MSWFDPYPDINTHKLELFMNKSKENSMALFIAKFFRVAMRYDVNTQAANVIDVVVRYLSTHPIALGAFQQVLSLPQNLEFRARLFKFLRQHGYSPDFKVDPRVHRSHLRHIALQMKMRKQETTPCNRRSKSSCMDECEWRNNGCYNQDLFTQYIESVCDKDLMELTGYKHEIRNVARHLGYTVRDFGKEDEGWKGVSKSALCGRISADLENIRKKLLLEAKPWKRLGISESVYRKLYTFGVSQRERGFGFWNILKNLRNYATRDNLVVGGKILVAIAVIVLAGVAIMSTGPTRTNATPQELRMFQEEHMSRRYMVPTTVLPPAPHIPFSSSDTNKNSILDKWASSKGKLRTYPRMLEGNSSFVLDARTMCRLGTSVEQEFIGETIERLRRRGDKLVRQDRWGIIPGQQIYYGGAFGVSTLTHHGIYIGDGLVFEVGQGPKLCKKDGRNILKFKDQMAGLSTLEDFAQRAIKLGSDIVVLQTPRDQHYTSVTRRLRRAEEIAGCWDYNIIQHNCQAAANYVSFGVYNSEQANKIIKAARVLVVSISSLASLVAFWKSKKVKK